MAVDAYQAVKEFVQQIFGGNDALALQYAQDPDGTLAAQGITEADLGQLDMYQLVSECAAEPGVPSGVQQAFQGYGSGGHTQYPVSPPPAHAGYTTTHDVVQHLNYVTYATYEGDTTITQQLINYENNYDYSTNIDNSVDVDVDGDFHGDIETTNVNATGDGAVAAGRDIEDSLINTGDGAVQAGGNIDGPVNTGEFTGIQAGDDVTNAVVGDHNQVAQVDGDADNSVFNFGGGDVTNFGDAHIQDSAVTVGGGTANNVSNNDIDEGAAVAAGGDATSDFQETDVEAHNSIVNTEQGPGNLEQEIDVDVDFNAHGHGHEEEVPLL